jgi:hypothetical protein
MATNPFQIVKFGVSQVRGPAPSKLQSKGAMVSLKGTTLAAGTTALITQLSDLTAILTPPAAITSLAWSGSVVTATTTVAHGITNAETAYVTIAGAVPAGYNGTFLATATGASTFTYALASNPGAETTPGTWDPGDVIGLTNACNVYFAQGPAQGYYVLETGAFSVTTEGLTAFEAYVAANPNAFYNYLMISPGWRASAAFATYTGTFTALTAMQYFTLEDVSSGSTYASFAGNKSVFFWNKAPSTPSTENSAAADWAATLSLTPSSSTPVPPNAFTFLFGVTPWPVTGQNTTLATLKAAFVNVVAPASVGNLTGQMVYLGTFMDGKPFNYWYAVDYAQINGNIDLTAAVINGSNNKLAPLYYNQIGINRLQAVLLSTMKRMITYGMALGQLIQTELPQAEFVANYEAGLYAGQVVVNADPFVSYTSENPLDYEAQTYGGLNAVFTPLLGFAQINVGLVVSDFPSGA